MVPVQGRRRQRGPLVRQGPLRLRLRQPPRPGAEADDARDDHRRRGARSSGTRRSASSPAGFREIQAEHGAGSIGGITSSRCTNEEVYVVQKMVRAAFGNNNVDTCARVCHSPTGYGLKQTFGTSAGTQDFKSVDEADVIMVIGANPTDGHPVFASRMKRRLREGAKLIVVDPRRIDLVRTPHIEATYHLQLAPGTNVAVVNAMAHVVVTEGLVDRGLRRRALRGLRRSGPSSSRRPENSPEAIERDHRRPRRRPARRRPAVRRRPATAAIYYGLGVTEHSQGSTMVMGMANLAMATGNIGREGVGVNPLRGQNNVQGSCDMGSFPHELPGYRHVSDDGGARRSTSDLWGTPILEPSRACASRTCSTPRSTARSGRCSCRARTSPSPTRTPSTCTRRWRRWTCSSCRTCSSTRRRSSPTCSCPARRSWRRTARSPTPSAGSTGSAR